MPESLDECYSVAVKAARHVGSIVKSRLWEAKLQVDTKTSAVDLVTETDQEVENYLITTLKTNFPHHAFIGEESTSQKCRLTLSPTWIIDPIDGTLNFVHGYPQVCISIALYVERVPEIAIIYNPAIEFFFEARRGFGAKLNGQPINVSRTTELSNALVSFEFGTSLDPEKMQNCVTNIKNILGKIRGFRSSGSAAMNMAMVALGGSDAYFEFGIHIWDIAAGALLVKEAGGVLIDPSGGEFDPLSRKVLCASTMPLAKQLSREIVQFSVERDGSLEDIGSA